MEKYTQEFTGFNGESRERHADSKQMATLEILSHQEAEVVGVIRGSTWRYKKTRMDGDHLVGEDADLVPSEEKIMWHDGRFLTRYDPDNYCHKPEMSRFHSPDIAFARWRKAIAEQSDKCSTHDIHWVYVKPFFYMISEEPRYYVITFGFNNGVSVSVGRGYNPNIVAEHYFHAKDFQKAVKLARKLKEQRGDKDLSISDRIRMFRPEVFKANPRRDHPGSDEFTKQMTGIVTSGMDKTVGAFALLAAAVRPR